MKTGSGNLVDIESLKALVSPTGPKITIEKVAKDERVLIPNNENNEKLKRGSSLRQVCFN